MKPSLLDTSVAISLRDNDPAVLQRFSALTTLPQISVLSIVELHGGVANDPDPQQRRRRALERMIENFEVVDFGEAHALAYGRIVSALGFSRRAIIDRMIAAQAIERGVTLVTLNPRDFLQIPDLAVEDWSQ
ncbi:MAG TPA: PIN domain-containing protein [Allosphingosinicella sp.]